MQVVFNETPTEEDLEHFGVKGMHWGIRKDKDSDGNITEMGKAHAKLKSEASNFKKKKSFANRVEVAKASRAYSNSQVDAYEAKGPSKRYFKLKEKYKAAGESENSARIHAYNRERTETVLAIVGGTALVAAGAYIAYKHYDRVADHFLKEGTNIGRVAPMNEELKDGFYAYTKNSDRKKYTRIFSNRVEHPMEVSMHVKKSGIKVASPDTARKALQEVFDENPQLKLNWAKRMPTVSKQKSLKASTRLWQRAHKDIKAGTVTPSVYDAVNTTLAYRDKNTLNLSNALYDKLKKQGYSAIKDVNDVKYSGYHSKNPLIIFDKSKIGIDNSEFVSPSDMEYGLESVIKPNLKRVASGASIAAGAKFIDSIARPNKGSGSSLKMISKYKSEHPNTKMSDSQILDSLQKGAK